MKKAALALTILLGLSGCASVPTADTSQTEKVLEFSAPSDSMAGIYIYRPDAFAGQALKKDVYLNGECVGETAPGVFFYEEVEGGKEHIIGTESEFSANNITLLTETGRLYFIEQYIKIGLFVGGAHVEVVDEETGRVEVAKTQMAIKGTCNNQ
ncbi:DUF2846 domain-containing protein [Vibrio renipiscarius]|uniref:DUF2846 domain-containing protein n=1 Tax=Vibrio renipiscarius TaxID=1461322 RepID=A0A0C2NQ52_9VIBR|nr:DUF2846 domain-containing protein [Vibrio renipiscarius]KII76307.1 hypothetical protein OJ16_16015 [Vibrio renipiscarius]KII78170.1 hypothetical protein PL18_14555 [Vibrio renipiscarius]